MATEETYLTTEGLRALEEELEDLRNNRRLEIAARIQEAKEIGDMENAADYEDAKSEQAFIEGRIQELERMIHNAIIIPDHSRGKKSDIVELGSIVKVERIGGKKPETYTIVGSTEASPADGKISNESPLGKALLGKAAGDEVQFTVPAGVQKFKIVSVR